MRRYKIWEAWGIELEYMVVHKDTLEIQPEVPWLLRTLSGQEVNEWNMGPITLSNELVSHVLEFKFHPPLEGWDGALEQVEEAMQEILSLLDTKGLTLLGTGAHPWMDPKVETLLWEGENKEIYQSYHRIFNCYRHGWANLQSTHMNLSFKKDQDFPLLHKTIRALLPFLPALTASTPYLDGAYQGLLDSRLREYQSNQESIPLIAGEIIPEDIQDLEEYEGLLNRIQKEIQPCDPEGILESSFLNSRGAITRAERGSIEIRLLDLQECPRADLAYARLIWGALWRWWAQRDFTLAMEALEQKELVSLYQRAIEQGENALIREKTILAAFELEEGASLGDFWKRELELQEEEMDGKTFQDLSWLLSHGSLATRLFSALGPSPSREELYSVYAQLAECLAQGIFFEP